MNKNKNKLWAERIAWFTVLFALTLIVIDIFLLKTEAYFLLNIGCSLLASSLFVIFSSLADSPNTLDEWYLTDIYNTRSEMNIDCDRILKRAERNVDIIAFGISSYREQQTELTSRLLDKGVNFRIITMDPNSKFAKQRDSEEKVLSGQTSKSISDLISWAVNMNSKSKSGNIQIKGYSCMTLDFYWRVDNVIYIGPYLYGLASQRTISFKYCNGGKGFEYYTDYFNKLWSDQKLLVQLVG